MHLAAFDTGFISYGHPVAMRIQETLQEAAVAEILGYTHFFVSEHHDDWAAWSNPTGLMSALAASTSNIHIGSAGLLARYHDPYAATGALKSMDAASGGRIVLGLCPSNGQKPCMTELYTRPEFDTLCVPEFQRHWPRPVWLFGRTGTLRLANELDLPFGYSLFHVHDAPASPASPEEFKRYTGPLGSIWLCVVCAETRAEAEAQRALVQASPVRVVVNICGTPSECRDQLAEYVAAYEPKMIGIMPGWHTSEARKFTYEAFSQL